MNIYLDLETVPATEPTESEIKACSAKRKPEEIEKDYLENRDALLAKALKSKSVSIYDSKIVCLGYAFGDGEVHAITGREDYILKSFSGAILDHHKENGGSPEGNTLFAFNGDGFDYPLLYLKSCLYKEMVVKGMVYFATKKDVMRMSAFNKYGTFVSLDAICKFFGIEGKGDIDGSMIYPMYKEGKIEEIAEYCRRDVEKTRKLEKILLP